MLTPPSKPGDINAWLLWIVQFVKEANELVEGVHKEEIPYEIVQNETVPEREYYMNPVVKLIG